MMWGNDYWTGWASGMGTGEKIMLLVFWVLIISCVVMLFRWLSLGKKTKFSNRLATPIDILQKRCSGDGIGRDDGARRGKIGK